MAKWHYIKDGEYPKCGDRLIAARTCDGKSVDIVCDVEWTPTRGFYHEFKSMNKISNIFGIVYAWQKLPDAPELPEDWDQF